jgi:lipid-binding SYLF domain-containing protein
MRSMRIVFACLCLALATPAMADKYQDTVANFKKSGIASKYFASSYGYAVFPTIGKGGLGIGGGGGKGAVFEGGKMIGHSTTLQLSIGLQMGGQAYSQIIFLKDKRAFDEFTSGTFEFGADASAVAITAGANAQTGTTGTSATASTNDKNSTSAGAEYYKGMAVLTLAKGGLMYQAAIAGQRYEFKKN